MANKSRIVRGPGPKIRKPVAKKPNTIMKSKKDYRRKPKHVANAKTSEEV